MSRLTEPSAPKRRGREQSVARLPASIDPRLLAFIDEVDLRFAEFLTRLREDRTHSKRTLDWYRRSYDAGLRPYLAEGDASTREALRARLFDISGLAAWLRRRVQPITVNNYWRALRPFFNDMEKRDGVPNPYKGAKAPRFNAPPPKGKSITDCEQILRAARNYPWGTAYEGVLALTLIGIMLFAGLRRSEVLDLEYSDIDLGSHTILVRHGKGMFGGRERVVPIAPQLEHLLRQYMRERESRRIVVPSLLVGVRGRPLGIGSVTNIIKNVRIAAGLHFTAHSLRHSFVTTLIMRGVPLPVVRDVAGHRDFATTLQYTNVQTPDRLAAVGMLDFLSPPSRVKARR